MQNSSTTSLLLRWGLRRLLLLFFLIRAHAPVEVRVSTWPAVVLLLMVTVVTVGTQSIFRSRCRGVVIVSDGDLLILFSLQQALVEAQCPLQDIFNLTGSKWATEGHYRNAQNTRPMQRVRVSHTFIYAHFHVHTLTCLSPASETRTSSSFFKCSWRITSWILPRDRITSRSMIQSSKKMI